MYLNLLAFRCVVLLHTTNEIISKGIKGANIALHKPARQISSYLVVSRRVQASASRAVDGRLNSLFKEGSCTHTAIDKTKSAWWEVDLKKRYRIGDIRILNRAAWVDRLHDLEIDVYERKANPRGKKHCTTYTGPAGQGWLNLTCQSPVMGRYVRITKPKKVDDDVLTLCEVEIYETKEKMNPRLPDGMRTVASSDSQKEMSYLKCCSICG